MTWDIVLCYILLVLNVLALSVAMFLEYRETRSLKKTFGEYVFIAFAIVCMGYAFISRTTLWGAIGLILLLIDQIIERYKKVLEEEKNLL